MTTSSDSQKLNSTALSDEQLIAAIGEKTIAEMAAFTEKLQKAFNISDVAFAPAAAVAVQGGETVEEKTEFNVILKGLQATESRMGVIRALRACFSNLGSEIGLKEAKELVEKAPVTIKTGVSKEVSQELKEKLSEAGAIVEIE